MQLLGLGREAAPWWEPRGTPAWHWGQGAHGKAWQGISLGSLHSCPVTITGCTSKCRHRKPNGSEVKTAQLKKPEMPIKPSVTATAATCHLAFSPFHFCPSVPKLESRLYLTTQSTLHTASPPPSSAHTAQSMNARPLHTILEDFAR